jgi:hypothetical protein
MALLTAARAFAESLLPGSCPPKKVSGGTDAKSVFSERSKRVLICWIAAAAED